MFKTQYFEKLWLGNKTEGESNGLSIERYCMMEDVPYSQFEKWFRSTCKEILPIYVDGAPAIKCARTVRKTGENAVNRKFRFADHSQKGTSVKKQAGGRDDDRDDFDGTQNPDAGIPEMVTLQSDGYNAYNYIDNQLVKIDHICCLAHAIAKFKYAQEQGQDDCATYFFERIAKLYQQESGCKRQNLIFGEIKTRRNSVKTADILTEMSCELMRLRDDGSPKGDLMEEALYYLDHFWKQIFNYRKEGATA